MLLMLMFVVDMYCFACFELICFDPFVLFVLCCFGCFDLF